MDKAVAEDKKLNRKVKEATGPDLLLLHPDVRQFVCRKRDIAHRRVVRWEQRLLLQPGHGIRRDDDVALMHRFRRPSGMDYTQPVRHLCKYWPLGNTWGNGADSSASKVPMLTNFVSMRFSVLAAPGRYGLQRQRHGQRQKKRQPPQHALNPLHPLLLLRIPLLILSFSSFFTASSCGVGNSSIVEFAPSDSVGRMVRELSPQRAVTSAKGYMYFFSPSPSPRYRR